MQVTNPTMNEANIAMNPYGSISKGFFLGEFQKEYFESLDKQMQSKVETIAARLHKNPNIKTKIFELIISRNYTEAEGLIFHEMEQDKRNFTEQTKLSYIDAAHEYVHIVSLSTIENVAKDVQDKTFDIQRQLKELELAA